MEPLVLDTTPIRHTNSLGQVMWQPRVGTQALQEAGVARVWAGIGGAGAVLYRSRRRAQRISERALRNANREFVKDAEENSDHPGL